VPDTVLDDFTDVSGWLAVASGQAQLAISRDDGPHGAAMKLAFDFRGGGGFVVARKQFSRRLPEAYAITFSTRGVAPANRFELKLSDASGRNVWWHHRDAFEWPADWQTLTIRSRDIEFAWGPAGGGSASRLGALELAIAAGPGGKGSVWISDLRLIDETFHATPVLDASSALPGHEPRCAVDRDSRTSWRSAAADPAPWLSIDFQVAREYGGLFLQWEPPRGACPFDVHTSNDGSEWTPVYAAPQARGERSFVYLPGTTSRYVRLNVHSGGGAEFGIVEVDVRPYDSSRSIDAFFHEVAKLRRKGLYPKYLTGEQTYWSPVGAGDGGPQALLNEEGMVEVDKGSFSLEPFLFVDDHLVTWADATIAQILEDAYLPLPSSEWRTNDIVLRTTAFASTAAGGDTLHVRYRVANSGPTGRQLSLFVAIRPFQVTPPWQAFRGLGGVSSIAKLAYRAGAVWVNESKVVLASGPPTGFGAAAFEQGAITDYLAAGELPPQGAVRDAFGYASGALRYDLDLAPHTSQDVDVAVPFASTDPARAGDQRREMPAVTETFATVLRHWRDRLGQAAITLPAAAQAYGDTLRTAAADILINRDGPALQPGPRRYTRCWIRDGAVMAAALLRTGCAAEACAFIRWYVGFQAADGTVPCCVDRDGPDWLVEHDSHGELIFTIMECFRFTGDRDFLAALWPAALRAVDHIDQLRRTRLTAEYETADKLLYRGLLPQSASHEGYLAHPVHSYWDDFWALRGLRDATRMAAALGDPAQERRIGALRDSFRATLYASIDATMRHRRIDYVPGSVEWADFDPTATANAISLLDELQNLPRAALDRTFAKYLDGFRSRRGNEIDWTNYTPYEIRIIGALVQMGQRENANELAEFFLGDRRPPPWNQWPEIAWRDPKSPAHIGDMPHAWIAAEYILALRSMLVFEREADQTLVVAAGVPASWLDEGGVVGVTDLPTYYGKLSFALRCSGAHTLRLSLSGHLTVPTVKIVVRPPLRRPLSEVTVNGRKVDVREADSITISDCPAEVEMH